MSFCTVIGCLKRPSVRWRGKQAGTGREWSGRACPEHVTHSVRVAEQCGYVVEVEQVDE